MEESPSSRAEIIERFPAQSPLGLVSGGNGSLGFGLGGALGARLAQPHRPVVCVRGDGRAMFGIQALWSGARYGAGALLVAMSNGNYGAMDAQAKWRNQPAPWPQSPGLDIAVIAGGMGCPAVRVETYEDMSAVLGAALDGLADRDSPLVVEAVIEQEDWSYGMPAAVGCRRSRRVAGSLTEGPA